MYNMPDDPECDGSQKSCFQHQVRLTQSESTFCKVSEQMNASFCHLYLVKGDTVKMASYFICYPSADEAQGAEIIFLERIPILYEKGTIVTFDEMFFKAEETHYTSEVFFSDVEYAWRRIPFPNKSQKEIALEWKSGVAGEDITASLQHNLWSTIKTEITAESKAKNRTNIIALRVTRYKLKLMIWFGVFLVAFGIIQRITKRNNYV